MTVPPMRIRSLLAGLLLAHLAARSPALQPAAGEPAKVGLAPHERPACQAPSFVHPDRRSLDRQLDTQTREKREEVAATSSAGNFSSALGATRGPHILQPLVVSADAAGKLLQRLAGHSGEPGAPPSSRSGFDSAERLRQLRQLLASNSYDAYLVTPNDEHDSEYVTDYDRRLRFISGFSGSKGYALIMLDRAVLFTDGRYALQADLDLDCNWWLVVSNDPLNDIHQWLQANAAKGLKIATDARFMSLATYDQLDEQIKRLESEFVLISQDLVDIVWLNAPDSSGRLLPQEPLFVHPLAFAGNVSWQEKLVRVADAMAQLKARHYIVSQLDDIAWLLNLRGSDVPMSPLFKAYLLISRSSGDPTSGAPTTNPAASGPARPALVSSGVDQLLGSALGGQSQLEQPSVVRLAPSQSIRLTLYVDLRKITPKIREHLHLDNGTFFTPPNRARSSAGSPSPSSATTRIQVDLKDYDVFIMDIRDKLARQLADGRLLLNSDSNVAIHVLAKSHENRLIVLESLIRRLKAVKSEAETEGMRVAHWRDSLAICMLLAQLERDIGQLKQTNKWTETSAASELEFYRSLMDLNRGQSFPTISAYGPNAAVVHYQPNPAERRPIGNQSTYLLDSGGQYLDGTTDITRTAHFGRPTDFQRETYTRVLMGAIDMMSLVFEASDRLPAYKLNDLLARRHLLEMGLDYAHGTGHGIGLYSLVHEAPPLMEHFATQASQRRAQVAKQQHQSAGPAIHSEPIVLQPNMFSSVEPGFYKANEFGIRLENIVVTRAFEPAGPPSPGQQRQLLRFEPISLVPFEPKLIKLELMSNKQKAWLNSYNLMVRLRMTQQINHYLTKLRDRPASGQPVQVSALSSSLFASTSGQANKSSDDGSPDQLNFMRLEPGRLQEKLEQTHKWIVEKTELVPLDVPAGSCPSAAAGLDKLQAQRLVLAYMASPPFGDPSAVRLLGSLAPEASLEARMGAANSSSQAEPQAASAGKCAGMECDLFLVAVLNQLGSRQHAQTGRAGWTAGQPTMPEPMTSGDEQLEAGRGAAEWPFLDHLFQLGGAERGASGAPMINVWLLLVFAMMLVIQFAMVMYICKGARTSRGSSNFDAPLESGVVALDAQ